ncbi:MAG: hypothetical protein NVS1B3_10830 [Candidatus Dormibacteraceae bacterium]
MIPRFLLAIALAAVMVVCGLTSYLYLGTRQSRVATVVQKPPSASPQAHAFTLPGTIYLVQSGALYSYSAGRFHQLTAEEGWTQPALYPDGSALVAVKRSLMYSDVYALTRFGQVGGRFTYNEASARDRWDTGANAWSFYPRLSPDQRTLYMSYDGPKAAYNNYYAVDLAVWGMPVGASMRQAKLWTNSNGYTGGDTQPVPVAAGGIVYTKYSYDSDDNRVGQLWYTNRPGAAGNALTTPGEDCSQPTFSPDGQQLAMICTYGKQISKLVIASWLGNHLGDRVMVIHDQLVAQPAWAPDGSGIAYLAPGGPTGPFQLWFLPRNAYKPPAPSPVPTPAPVPGGPHNGPLPSPAPSVAPPPPVVKPIQMTTNLGFDATSPLAWLG